MKNSILIIGIILLVLGAIGLLLNYYTTWMWVLVVLGVVGVVWGWLAKK
ncbi:MAG: hypothetical protein ABSF55_03250 [Candidatus Staskawiczbacteria bacterium]|jgi:hypothetical protein